MKIRYLLIYIWRSTEYLVLTYKGFHQRNKLIIDSEIKAGSL